MVICCTNNSINIFIYQYFLQKVLTCFNRVIVTTTYLYACTYVLVNNQRKSSTSRRGFGGKGEEVVGGGEGAYLVRPGCCLNDDIIAMQPS